MLHLISVSIDGFLSHGNIGTLPLDEPGITHIRGATGHGKSTIFEVVYYLLMGETIRETRQVATLANSVLQNGYDIALDYQVDANRYTVQEIRGRPGAGLFFWKNGDPVLDMKDTRELRLKILASLGMTPDDFCALAFVGQNQFYTLVYGKSGDRSKEIIRIFGLNQYDQALKDCGADVKESVDQRALLITKIDEIKVELNNLEEQFQTAQPIQTVVDDTLLAARRIELVKVEAAIAQVRSKYDLAVAEVGKAKALREKCDLALGIQREIEDLKSKLAGLGPADQSIAELQKAYDSAKDRLSEALAEVKQAQGQLTSVQKLNDRCPINREVCPINVPIEYKSVQIKRYTGLITTGKEGVAASQQKAQQAENQLESAKRKNTIQTKLLERKKDLENLGEVSTFGSAGQEAEAERLKELLARGEKKQKKLNDQIAELREAKAAQLKEQEYRQRMEKVLADKRKGLTKYQANLADHDLEHQYLVATLNVLKKAKAYKIDYVINRLNIQLGKNLDYISDGMFQARFASQRKDSTGKKLIDDIELMFSDSYKEIPIELASPGQQAYVCLAMIPTVFETARGITDKAVSSLWLDEVLGPISDDLLDRSFELLVELIRGLGVQSVKIITHRAIDSRFFDHTWDVKMENGVSKVDLV